jgi:choice-of-anchor C domain-containing protein
MFPVVVMVAASVVSAPVPKAFPELVKNGSFEEGPETTSFVAIEKGAETITGWTVTRGGIDYIDSYWQPGDGKRSLDLHGSPGFGGVKQTLAVKKGRTYTVTFQMASTPAGTPVEKALWVAAAGAKKKFSFDATGKTNEDMGWKKMMWEFTADADEVGLEFYTAETEQENCGPALDNVSVREKK